MVRLLEIVKGYCVCGMSNCSIEAFLAAVTPEVIGRISVCAVLQEDMFTMHEWHKQLQ